VTIQDAYRKFSVPGSDIINRAEKWIAKYPLLSNVCYRSAIFPFAKWVAWRLRDLTGYTENYKNQKREYYKREGKELPEVWY
jgi:hypothetical protein